MNKADESKKESDEWEGASELRTEAIRKEAEEMMKGVFSEEVRKHMIKAGSELLLALEAMMPESRLPAETKHHYHQMRREFLLMAKSIIDSRLDVAEGKKAGQGLKKIEVD